MSSSAEEAEPEQAGQDEGDLGPQHVADVGGDDRQAADEAREQQESGLDRDRLQVEQFQRPRAAGGRTRQHRVGRIEAGEHHEVAEQEHPEAEGGDDALRRGSALADGASRSRDRTGSSFSETFTSRMPGSRPSTRSTRASRRSASIRCDFAGRDFVLVVVAPGEHDEGRESAGDADRRHPPDVPDQREAGDDGEEGDDEAGRTVDRHLDRFVARQRRKLAPARSPAA